MGPHIARMWDLVKTVLCKISENETVVIYVTIAKRTESVEIAYRIVASSNMHN